VDPDEAGVHRGRGRLVQVDPIKPTLKALGIKLLNLEYGKSISNFAFKFNVRRYTGVDVSPAKLLEHAAVGRTRTCSKCPPSHL
jgi:hypothetical protein